MILLLVLSVFAGVFAKPAPFKDPMINEGLFEGDIAGFFPSDDRNAIVGEARKWPNARVPYIISPEKGPIRDLILNAMKHIESVSCIRFVGRTNEESYVKIVKREGCWSHWGRTGREQELSLGEGCDNFAVIVHELMHAIGFEHEHNRSDRDDYLTIHWENIVEKWYYAFKKLRPDQNRLLTQFDFNSFMLYGSRSFAKDYDKYSMTTKDGRYIPDVYHRTSMSVLDAKRINMLYNCPGQA